MTALTHLHSALKSGYRKKEPQLILQKLSSHPQKVLAPDCNDMMKMLEKSMETVKFHYKKTVWVMNALNGSEDFLISDKIMALF